MFGPLPATPVDFAFRLGPIPVHVSGWHWVGAIVIGWPRFQQGQFNGQNLGLPMLAMFMLAVFVSILVHELGHVLAYMACGARGAIRLVFFGGLAIPDRGGFSTWRQVGISIAGPAAQVPLAIAAWLALRTFGTDLAVAGTNAGTVTLTFLMDLIWINTLWPLLNLLPILPLDGGRISEALFMRYTRNGTWWIDRVAVAVAVVCGVLAYRMGYTFGLLLLFMFVVPHIQRMQQG